MNQITEELNKWIKEHGCERDALNVAITRLRLAEAEIEAIKAQLIESLEETTYLVAHDCDGSRCRYGYIAHKNRANAEIESLKASLREAEDDAKHLAREAREEIKSLRRRSLRDNYDDGDCFGYHN